MLAGVLAVWMLGVIKQLSSCIFEKVTFGKFDYVLSLWVPEFPVFGNGFGKSRAVFSGMKNLLTRRFRGSITLLMKDAALHRHLEKHRLGLWTETAGGNTILIPCSPQNMKGNGTFGENIWKSRASCSSQAVWSSWEGLHLTGRKSTTTSVSTRGVQSNRTRVGAAEHAKTLEFILVPPVLHLTEDVMNQD